jgi:transcription antitermination protein NusB
MTRRSRAREVALQLLFQKDQNPKPVARSAVERFARERLLRDETAIAFCLALFDGVAAHQPEIDLQITATAENWRLNRMMPVDRNLLRLGAYEMLHAADPTPPAVAIDEAIELARRFGSVDSPAFVNGVLDRIAKSRSAERGARSEEPAAESPSV